VFRLDMEEFEHVTCMKNAWLNPGPYTTVRQNYIVLGTCNVMGEEMNSRGKVGSTTGCCLSLVGPGGVIHPQVA